MYRQSEKKLLNSNISPHVPTIWWTSAHYFGTPQQISTAFASWQRYCTVLQQWASAKLCGVEQRAPPIFGRAAITLGIGPHSSSFCVAGKTSVQSPVLKQIRLEPQRKIFKCCYSRFSHLKKYEQKVLFKILNTAPDKLLVKQSNYVKQRSVIMSRSTACLFCHSSYKYSSRHRFFFWNINHNSHRQSHLTSSRDWLSSVTSHHTTYILTTNLSWHI